MDYTPNTDVFQTRSNNSEETVVKPTTFELIGVSHIQKTEEIVNHRGDRPEDGLIRVEVKFELPPTPITRRFFVLPQNVFYDGCGGGFKGGACGGTGDFTPLGSNIVSSNCSFVSESSSMPLQDEGITVKGSESNQQFQFGYIGCLESHSTVIVLRLRGFKNDKVLVEKPLTVSTKVQCSICGRFHRSDKKFCSNCGNFLM